MKKLTLSMIALAMTAMTFTSCEDVPAPYDYPGTGGNEGGGELAEGVYLDETFTKEIENFEVITQKGTPWSVYNNKYVIGSGYDSNTGVTTESESYLVSKEIDLSESTNAHLTFEYIFRYDRGGCTNKVYITDNYSGDPTTTNWTDITGTLTEGSDWNTWYSFDENIPADFIGKKTVRIALYYACGTSSTTWELKNLKLQEGETENTGGGNQGGEEGIEITCAKAIELCNALEDGASSTETYSITGYITDVYATVNNGQQSFWMSDNNDGQKMVQAYWANLPEGIDAFTKGSKVKIVGKLLKYVNKSGEVVTEIKNADVDILENGSSNPDTPSGDIKHITIAEFLSKADTENAYELTGIVKNISNNIYGNFDLVEGDASIYIYGLLDKDGNTKNFASLNISEGDEVTLTGVYCLYNDKPEITNAQFISVKKAEGGNEGEVTPSGDNLLANGDFEAWNGSIPVNWKSASTASSATLSQKSDAHGGSYSVGVGFAETSNKRIAYKEITLKAGTYKFSFYAKSTTENPSQCRPGYVPVKSGSVGTYSYGDYASIKNSSWTLVEHEFSLTETTTLCLVVMNPKTSSYATAQEILIDDASLTTKDGGLVE